MQPTSIPLLDVRGSDCIFLPTLSHTCQEGKLTSCWKVVNYLLETYAKDDIIVEAYMDITNFKPPAGEWAFECTQALCTKATRCGPVYD